MYTVIYINIMDKIPNKIEPIIEPIIKPILICLGKCTTCTNKECLQI